MNLYPFLRGTNPEYINELLDYTQQADHDDAPESAVCWIAGFGEEREVRRQRTEWVTETIIPVNENDHEGVILFDK